MGAIYIIHLAEPIGKRQSNEVRAQYGHGPRKTESWTPQAQHYMGFADNVETRIKRHLAGNGSHFMARVAQLGVKWRAFVLEEGPDVMPRREKWYKKQHNGPRFCPLCSSRKYIREVALEEKNEEVETEHS